MALTARKYNQPITLIKITLVQDDFGKGAFQLREDMLHTFAKAIQTNNSRARIENTNARQSAMQFAIRYTDVEFNAVAYKGQEYTVTSVINIDEANRELIIDAQRAE
jgi:hypothetical protein